MEEQKWINASKIFPERLWGGRLFFFFPFSVVPFEVLFQHCDLTKKKKKQYKVWQGVVTKKKKIKEMSEICWVNLLINFQFQSLSCFVGEEDASCSNKFVIIEACRSSRLYSAGFAPCTKLIFIITGAPDNSDHLFNWQLQEGDHAKVVFFSSLDSNGNYKAKNINNFFPKHLGFSSLKVVH